MARLSRGAPHPLAADPNDTVGWITLLAQWVNEIPGVAPYTTTQRNALTGADIWDGRVVLNTTIDKLQRYDAPIATWVDFAESRDLAALLAATGTPSAPNAAGTGSRGVSDFAARADHFHPEFALDGNLTLAANAVTAGEGNTIYRRGRQVTMCVYAQATAAIGSGVAIVTAPDSNYFPPRPIRDVMSGTGVTRQILVSTAGAVSVEGGLSGAGQLLYGTVSYPV